MLKVILHLAAISFFSAQNCVGLKMWPLKFPTGQMPVIPAEENVLAWWEWLLEVPLQVITNLFISP